MLPEERRSQLDGIVQRMVQNNEPDQNIQAVVEDFKQKYGQAAPPTKPQGLAQKTGNMAKGIGNFFIGAEKAAGQDIAGAILPFTGAQKQFDQSQQNEQNSQTALLKQIQKDRAQGKDVSRLLTALNQPSSLPTAQQFNPAIAKSNWEVGADFAGVAADVLSAGTYGKAAKGMETGVLKGGIPSAFKLAAETPVVKAGIDKTIETIAPKMTAKETAEAIAKQGTKKTGLLGKIKVNPDPYLKKVAETVKEMVPKFNPKNLLTENISHVRTALDSSVEELKNKVITSGKDRAYTFKELSSRLKKVEEPLSLMGTPFEKQIGPLKDAVLKIAKEKGGKVSSLLDVRKEFDSLVQKTWPNLYESASAPMRSAVTSIRNEVTKFTEENLPKEIGLKKTLTKQSHLINAIENMAEKAASGAEKEVGQMKFAAKHPGAVKALKSTAKTAVKIGLGVAGLEGLKAKFPNLPLP